MSNGLESGEDRDVRNFTRCLLEAVIREDDGDGGSGDRVEDVVRKFVKALNTADAYVRALHSGVDEEDLQLCRDDYQKARNEVRRLTP